jgi:WXG100 family type VII secretion target
MKQIFTRPIERYHQEGNMPSDLLISYEELQRVSGQFAGKVGELDQALNQIQNQIQSLTTSFQGQTAQQFQALMAEWTKDAQAIRNVLSDVGQRLGQTAEDAINWDRDSARRFQSNG